MKHIKLNDSGGQSRSVMIETRHGKIEVFCNSDYTAIELQMVPYAKETFNPIFIELNGKVFDSTAKGLKRNGPFRAKLRRKDNINMGELAKDSEKKALVDEWIASKQASKELNEDSAS